MHGLRHGWASPPRPGDQPRTAAAVALPVAGAGAGGQPGAGRGFPAGAGTLELTVCEPRAATQFTQGAFSADVAHILEKQRTLGGIACEKGQELDSPGS